jgi:predicted flap endonuclease-1-like 5' DNA nuclease
MEVGLFVLGILVGVGLAWYLLDRYQRDESEAREANHNARLAALQDELRESDSALAETKDRLIALQMEHRTADARAKSLEADAAQAKRAAEQAVEQEMRQRQIVGELQNELDALRRAPSARAAQPVQKPAPAAQAVKAGDDLTEIRGIGKVIERRLRELGVTSFRQLAELSQEDAKKINDAIDFPGRVERERWVEQARTLLQP